MNPISANHGKVDAFILTQLHEDLKTKRVGAEVTILHGLGNTLTPCQPLGAQIRKKPKHEIMHKTCVTTS